MAHTPGPWKLEQYGFLCVEAEGHLGPLATVCSRLDYSGMNPIVAETREANARLIAAAPDLLDALKTLVDCASYGPVMDTADAWIDARAAIAKATLTSPPSTPPAQDQD